MSKASVKTTESSPLACSGSPGASPSLVKVSSQRHVGSEEGAVFGPRGLAPNGPDRWEAAAVLRPSSPARQMWSEAAGSERVF